MNSYHSRWARRPSRWARQPSGWARQPSCRPLGRGLREPLPLVALPGKVAGLSQALQGGQIAGLIAGIVDRGFQDEGSVGAARVLQEALEGSLPQLAGADVLVPVQMAAADGFGVVGVP